MQNLYYNSGSGITSSLLLIKEDNTREVWTNNTITNLIVSGALGEILAFSGSIRKIAFPIQNTNLYYNIDYSQILFPENTQSFSPPQPPPFPQSPPSGILRWNFGFANLDPDYLNIDNPAYSISSGSFLIERSGSASTGSNSISVITGSYNLSVFGAFTPFISSYTSSIVVYDNTVSSIFPIISISGSSNVALTSSLFISSSHTYVAYLFISGTHP